MPILNELYALKFYKSALQDALFASANGWLKFALLALVCFGNFLFYVAILHFANFIFCMETARKPNFAQYFFGTIFVLAYVSVCMICAGGTAKFTGTEPNTFVQKNVKILLQNGEEILLNAKSINRLKSEISTLKERSKLDLQASANAYIDGVYDAGAREVARKMADFNYSFLSDYLVLWHGA